MIGFILSLAALIPHIAANRYANRDAPQALVSLFAVGTGRAVVAMAARDLIVASWIA